MSSDVGNIFVEFYLDIEHILCDHDEISSLKVRDDLKITENCGRKHRSLGKGTNVFINEIINYKSQFPKRFDWKSFTLDKIQTWQIFAVLRGNVQKDIKEKSPSFNF